MDIEWLHQFWGEAVNNRVGNQGAKMKETPNGNFGEPKTKE